MYIDVQMYVVDLVEGDVLQILVEYLDMVLFVLNGFVNNVGYVVGIDCQFLFMVGQFFGQVVEFDFYLFDCFYWIIGVNNILMNMFVQMLVYGNEELNFVFWMFWIF